MYLAWYDASKKLTPAEKVANARVRYVEKFGQYPTEVLINQDVHSDLLRTLIIPLRVKPLPTIAPNTFWIGTPEDNT